MFGWISLSMFPYTILGKDTFKNRHTFPWIHEQMNNECFWFKIVHVGGNCKGYTYIYLLQTIYLPVARIVYIPGKY